MYADSRPGFFTSLLLALVATLAFATPALAQRSEVGVSDDAWSRWWLSAGLGQAAVTSPAAAPSAGHNGMAASLDVGYRITPQWSLGFEYGGVAPLSGCTVWKCASAGGDFAPNFTRLMAFAEYRPRYTGWRFSAGTGISRFCHSRHWSDSAWGWGDSLEVLISALLDDDYEDDSYSRSGAWHCDARTKALGGAVSAGYDWPAGDHSPVTMGLRLTAEAAGFGATPSIGLPAFKHRAVMLTLHLNIH